MTARNVGFGEALRPGFALAWKAKAMVGLGFFAEVGADLLSLGVAASLAAWVLASLQRSLGANPALLLDPESAAHSFLGQLLHGRALIPLTGAILVATLLSLALRLLWFAAAARTFALKLNGQDAPHGLAIASLHRAVPVAALFVPIYLAVALFNATALGSGLLSFGTARSGGFLGAMSLAFAIAAGTWLSFVADSLLRLSLVRAVAQDAGPVDALASAARVFSRAVPTILGILVVFGLLGGVANTVSSAGGVVMIGSGSAAVALLLFARALSGLLGSLVKSFLATAELGAFAALDAGDRGVLPEPVVPPPPAPPEPLPTVPISAAEPVLETSLAPEIKPLG